LFFIFIIDGTLYNLSRQKKNNKKAFEEKSSRVLVFNNTIHTAQTHQVTVVTNLFIPKNRKMSSTKLSSTTSCSNPTWSRQMISRLFRDREN